MIMSNIYVITCIYAIFDNVKQVSQLNLSYQRVSPMSVWTNFNNASGIALLS